MYAQKDIHTKTRFAHIHAQKGNTYLSLYTKEEQTHSVTFALLYHKEKDKCTYQLYSNLLPWVVIILCQYLSLALIHKIKQAEKRGRSQTRKIKHNIY